MATQNTEIFTKLTDSMERIEKLCEDITKLCKNQGYEPEEEVHCSKCKDFRDCDTLRENRKKSGNNPRVPDKICDDFKLWGTD